MTIYTKTDIDAFRKDVLDPAYREEYQFFPPGECRFHYRNPDEADTAFCWFGYYGAKAKIEPGDVVVVATEGLGHLRDIAQYWPVKEVVEPFLTQYLARLKSYMHISGGYLEIDCNGEYDHGGTLHNVMTKAADCGLLPNDSFFYQRGSLYVGNRELLAGLRKLGVDIIPEAMCKEGVQSDVSGGAVWEATVAVGGNPAGLDEKGDEWPAHWRSKPGSSYRGTLAAVDGQRKTLKEMAERESSTGEEPGEGAARRGRS